MEHPRTAANVTGVPAAYLLDTPQHHRSRRNRPSHSLRPSVYRPEYVQRPRAAIRSKIIHQTISASSVDHKTPRLFFSSRLLLPPRNSHFCASFCSSSFAHITTFIPYFFFFFSFFLSLHVRAAESSPAASVFPPPPPRESHARPAESCFALRPHLDEAPPSQPPSPIRLLPAVQHPQSPMSWDLLQRFLESDVFNANPFLSVSYLS